MLPWAGAPAPRSLSCDPGPCVVDLADLAHNRPGLVDSYRLGAERVDEETPPPVLRTTAASRPSRPIVEADSRLAPPVGLSTRPLDTVSTGLQTNRLSIGQTTINSHTWFKVRNIERLLMCNISRSDLACTICVSYATKTLRCVADHFAALTAMHVTPMAAPCHPGRCRRRGHSEGEVGQRWSHQELALLSTTSSQIPFRG